MGCGADPPRGMARASDSQEPTAVHRVALALLGPDPVAEAKQEEARLAGFGEGLTLTRERFYFLDGVGEAAARTLAGALADPVVERWVLDPPPPPGPFVDVTLHPGVFDAEGAALLGLAARLGIGLARAASGTRWRVAGLDPAAVPALARAVLYNPVVEHAHVGREAPPPWAGAAPAGAGARTVPLRELDDAGLLALSTGRRLALDLEEMRAIQAFFRQAGREPTDLELETLAQTWSEHCAHKTFRARIVYRGPTGPDPAGPVEARTIDGLLAGYLRAVYQELRPPWVRAAIAANAGLFALSEDWDLAFKVETHNHPSAIEPFGGANTGVGGVIRDVLAMGARPIANLDVLFFGPLDTPDDRLPPGTLPPRRVYRGVIAGIEDYGNKMGIPTVGGAIYFHPGYRQNPLVYAGTLGIQPAGSYKNDPAPGDLVVLVGGRTGRDGLGGATFSSLELDATTAEVAGAAVQIGDPITEKQVQELILAARDEGLYTALTDCGAGGLSSAVGEMGEAHGVEVELAEVPLKYPGLAPWEIWLSEAQERMVMAVPEDRWPRLRALARRFGVPARAIGRFTGDGELVVRHRGEVVGRLPMAFLHGGRPQRRLAAHWRPPAYAPPPPAPDDPAGVLLALLGHPNIRSRRPVIERYDHEVQGQTLTKPLAGPGKGPQDGAVVWPRELFGKGPAVALAVGVAPTYTALDPYRGAWAAVDEAVRNLVAAGGDPERIALLDNYSWGNPELPDRLGGLVRATLGLADAARAYRAPFVSGKDSLNNEYLDAEGRRHPIPGTLVVSGAAPVPEPEKAPSIDLKAEGNRLYLVGATAAEFGGSHYAWIATGDPGAGGLPPAPAPEGPDLARALFRAIRSGLVRSVHDLAEGGLAVAAAEMALSGGLGARIALERVPARGRLAPWQALFSESLARWLVEVAPSHAPAFEALFQGLPLAAVGEVGGGSLVVTWAGGGLELGLPELAAAFGGEDG